MMTIRIPRLALVISAAILWIAVTPNAGLAASAQARTTANDPTHFIQTLAAKAIATLADKSGTLDEREGKFRDMLHNEFAMKRIGRFVIGIHWRNMDRTQKNAYQKLFSQWLLKTYSSLLGGYSGQKFEVTKTSDAGKGDIIVHSRILVVSA